MTFRHNHAQPQSQTDINDNDTENDPQLTLTQRGCEYFDWFVRSHNNSVLLKVN